MEEQKNRALFDDEKDDEDTSPVKRLHLTLSTQCSGSESDGSLCGRFDGASFVC